MKQQISLAAFLLISSSSATKTPEGHPVYPAEFHFNEDPHSVPDPISGKKYMTATQAKYLRKKTWDTDTEDTSIHPGFHADFNASPRVSEPKPAAWMTKYWGGDPMAVQLRHEDEDTDSDSSSSGSDSDSEDEKDEKKEEKPKQEAPKEEAPKQEAPKKDAPQEKQNILWKQTPDLGELDDHSTLYREFDAGRDQLVGKPKYSGWTNPLSWTDGGDDDDVVLVQMTQNGPIERHISDKMMLQYEESEGPTKVDLGDLDMHVVPREADKAYLEGGAKFHGWTNPLGWTDDGEDDSKVI